MDGWLHEGQDERLVACLLTGEDGGWVGGRRRRSGKAACWPAKSPPLVLLLLLLLLLGPLVRLSPYQCTAPHTPPAPLPALSSSAGPHRDDQEPAAPVCGAQRGKQRTQGDADGERAGRTPGRALYHVHCMLLLRRCRVQLAAGHISLGTPACALTPSVITSNGTCAAFPAAGHAAGGGGAADAGQRGRQGV